MIPSVTEIVIYLLILSAGTLGYVFVGRGVECKELESRLK